MANKQGSLIIENWDIKKLVPYAYNPRKNDEVVDRMCDAIREFGFRIPIVAKSDGTVVDGHLRLKAALKLGIQEVPVALADELTDTQVKAFRLLANQSPNWAEWDIDLLRSEIEDLEDAGFNIGMIGFEDTFLDSLKPVDIDSFFQDDPAPKNKKKDEVFTCPHCHKSFTLTEMEEGVTNEGITAEGEEQE